MEHETKTILNVRQCPNCKKNRDIVKNGIRYLKGKTKQAYLCKNCGHRFYEKNEGVVIWSMN